LGKDSTALAGVRAGTIGMSTTGNPYFTGIVPKLNGLDLPYQFASAEQAYKVLMVQWGGTCSMSWMPSSSSERQDG
jgi:TRAP-type C4-dicarboxylate transport system substrate-binding protein